MAETNLYRVMYGGWSLNNEDYKSFSRGLAAMFLGMLETKFKRSKNKSPEAHKIAGEKFIDTIEEQIFSGEIELDLDPDDFVGDNGEDADIYEFIAEAVRGDLERILEIVVENIKSTIV